MRLGLALPHYDFSLPGISRIDWPFVRDWAQRAEELGFDSIWVSDHLFLDLSKYGGNEQRYSSLECFACLGALAMCTREVRLGALVVANDLRYPAVVAKMAASLHSLSSGRFELGLGAGWYEPEFQAAGVRFGLPGERIERLGEAVQLIRMMVNNDQSDFDGKHYQLKQAWNLPRLGPDEKPLPVFVGGKGDRVARLAGRYADGFNSVWAWTPEAYAGRIKVLEQAARKAGRDPSTIKKSVGLYALPGRDEAEIQMRWQRYLAGCPPGVSASLDLQTWRQDKLAGTAEYMAETLKAFGRLGVEEVILSFGLLPFQICDASGVEDLIKQVKPLVA